MRIRSRVPRETRGMKTILLQQAGFNSVWVACALGGAAALSWPGLLASALFLAWTLHRSDGMPRDLVLIACAVFLGLLLDLFLVGGGWLSYPGSPLTLAASPVWILALWAAFAPTLPVTYTWLRGRIPLAVLVGALGGCLACYAGSKLGALSVLPPEQPGWGAVALGWGTVLPLLVAASSWLDARSALSPTVARTEVTR